MTAYESNPTIVWAAVYEPSINRVTGCPIPVDSVVYRYRAFDQISEERAKQLNDLAAVDFKSFVDALLEVRMAKAKMTDEEHYAFERMRILESFVKKAQRAV